VDRNVTDLIDYMSEADGWLPVIAYTERPATQRVVQAIMAGAIDYLEWPFTVEKLQDVLGSAETTATLIGSLRQREAMARQRLRRLTRREREVLAGVAGGLSNRMIGEMLAISPRTVEIHRANLLNKIGASRTSEAIRIAIEASLVH
jgi:FixJ family two-component response regulator